MRKIRKRSKGRVIVYAEKRHVPANPDPTKRPFHPGLLYFARFRGSKRLVRITRQQYDGFIGNESLRLSLERKQGGKKGHGEVPGAGHCWPMKVEALACHKSQVAAFNERNKKHGINVTYDPNGFAIVPDNGAYKRLLKAEGAHHRNSYS